MTISCAPTLGMPLRWDWRQRLALCSASIISTASPVSCQMAPNRAIRSSCKPAILFLVCTGDGFLSSNPLLRICQRSGRLEIEVLSCIMIADVADYFSDPFDIIGQFSIGHFFSEDVAENTAKIFVPR